MSATATPADLEIYRRELTGYCYRMLGSANEAEDAVQETISAPGGTSTASRAGPLRSWLYRIATNVCLDMLQRRERRARPMDLGRPRGAAAANRAPPGHLGPTHPRQPVTAGARRPRRDRRAARLGAAGVRRRAAAPARPGNAPR